MYLYFWIDKKKIINVVKTLCRLLSRAPLPSLLFNTLQFPLQPSYQSRYDQRWVTEANTRVPVTIFVSLYYSSNKMSLFFRKNITRKTIFTFTLILYSIRNVITLPQHWLRHRFFLQSTLRKLASLATRLER